MVILAGVFLFSGAMIIIIQHQYNASKKIYAEAADRYTAPAPTKKQSSSDSEKKNSTSGDKSETPDSQDVQEEEEDGNTAPITVNFDALVGEYPDVVGWIYCEGTVINYPVVQASNNDYYLHRNYDGTYNASGSIFVEAKNARGFTDTNTIMYGHHMNNGSMFAGLEDWASQEYYDAHPVMWLLTPTQDYKIELISSYTTSAFSDVYTIYANPCAEMSAYLDSAVAQSDFQTTAEVDYEAKYVLLSTCAYVFDNARYVVHGKLVPVDSAGGVELPKS